ncbi:MAG: translation elongation factor Ts [Pirellulales bacterium]
MAQITAADVKALRDKTQLPMMECKRALQETDGDQEAAIRLLREQGKKTMAKRADRATECGRIAIYVSLDPGVGSMVELQCESAQVAVNDDFMQLAADLATQLATGPGAETAEALWSQPSPSQPNRTLEQQRDDLANRIREVFRLERIIRVDKPCGGYVHHTGTDGVLLEIEGTNADIAKEVSMQVAAMKPQFVAKEDVPAEDVAKEREILMTQARSEGKPENIIEKMVEGRLRNFYAARVLLEQPFIKDEKQTVGAYAKGAGVRPIGFVHWQLGKGE